MRKILLPILSTIFSLTTLATAKQISAQTITNNCQNRENQDRLSHVCQHSANKITKQKWRTLVKRYYQSRYRTKFKANNDFLSLKEVNILLGFSGTRNKIEKKSSHQYWSWRDESDPHKRIEGIFVYHQLVGLRIRGFDRIYLKQLKSEVMSDR